MNRIYLFVSEVVNVLMGMPKVWWIVGIGLASLDN